MGQLRHLPPLDPHWRFLGINGVVECTDDEVMRNRHRNGEIATA